MSPSADPTELLFRFTALRDISGSTLLVAGRTACAVSQTTRFVGACPRVAERPAPVPPLE
jgi:hypothetical protein